jgi:hypothetical protein
MVSCLLRLQVIRQEHGRIAEILARTARNGNQNEAFRVFVSRMLIELRLGNKNRFHFELMAVSKPLSA